MDIEAVADILETRFITNGRGSQVPYWVLPEKKLGEFEAAVDFLKLQIRSGLVPDPEDPKHCCLLAEIFYEKNRSLQFLLDEAAAFGLSALVAKRTVDKLDGWHVADYLKLWKDSAQAVLNIQSRHRQIGLLPTRKNPRDLGLVGMVCAANEMG